MKPKKLFVTDAVTKDELLIGLETMKEWGILPKSFQEPNIEAFYISQDVKSPNLKPKYLQKHPIVLTYFP